MAFTREQIEEFIAALHADAELRERVRGAILADDFQALPGLVRGLGERLESLAQGLNDLTARLETYIAATDMRFERLETRMDRVEKRLDDIAGRLGNVEGDFFEERFIRNVRAHIGPRFRRPRQLDVYSDETVERALAKHALSEQELKDVATADLIVWSYDTQVGEERALVIEVSRTVDVSDVTRAQRRAHLLASAGVDAVPVVAGAALSHEAASVARQLSVVTLVQQPEPAA